MKTAADVMTTDVQVVRQDATLREAGQMMIEHHISGLPVIDETGALVGVISESDLLNKERRRSAIPRLALFGVTPIPEETLMKAYQDGLSLKVADVMSKKVLTASPSDSLESLAALLVKSRINRVPVVEDGKVVGIVTREDVLRGMLG